MRDIFNELFESEPPDPMEAARRNMRPALRQRFYKAASVAEQAGGFAVILDDKPVRTPARRALAAPSRAPTNPRLEMSAIDRLQKNS